MKAYWKPAAIVLLIIGSLFAVANSNNQKPAENAHVAENPEEVLTYFIQTMTEDVQNAEKEYDKLGLDGGVDAFALVRTYPRLEKNNFQNIPAYQGGYSMKGDELMFTGNAASNSAVIEREGMRMLLKNIAASLNMPIDSRAGIDAIIIELRAKGNELTLDFAVTSQS